MNFLPTIILPAFLILAAPAEETILLREHFPLGEGLVWRYNSNLGEVRFSVAVAGERVTVDSRSRRLDIVQEYHLAPEGLFLTSSRRDAFLCSSRRTYHPFLFRFPAEVRIGQAWEWKGKEVVNRRNIIESRLEGMVEGRETVTVPAGEFDCLRVTVKTFSSDGTVSTSTQWLASGVGIVKVEAEIDPGRFTGFIISLLGFDRFYMELVEMTGPHDRSLPAK